ncbi:hypothetical protein FQA47_024957 [Oryzias melastigma]|uniref:Uncharacterized protein n=1 Tax=Oryzias melastigma TaxID=30732 RepID=A0A834C089_ORYME|nr:hypothetical protein FQA47_024957 [Oryzias melastigma]
MRGRREGKKTTITPPLPDWSSSAAAGYESRCTVGGKKTLAVTRPANRVLSPDPGRPACIPQSPEPAARCREPSKLLSITGSGSGRVPSIFGAPTTRVSAAGLQQSTRMMLTLERTTPVTERLRRCPGC